MKAIKFCLLLVCFSCCLIGCAKLNARNSIDSDYSMGGRFAQLESSLNNKNGKLSEIATPKLIQELNNNLEQFSPQVKIITPRINEVFKDPNVGVEIQVQNLSLFKDEKLKMGPHLNLILDNEPFRQIYNLDQPIVLENLTPGTHTLRVFAARPWDESFKNEGAYAQTSFSILTKTEDNSPNPNLPLLTYNSPNGIYSGEPIMLDFYLTNAPLHVVARENFDDNIKDWKIKITINGESFFTDSWQPIYLTGLEKGNNWIQLELLDENGNNIENVFNNTVRVINYNPQQQDTLAKIVTGKISLIAARPIVEQNYYIQPVGTPDVIESESESKNNSDNESESKNIKPEIIPEESLNMNESVSDSETEHSIIDDTSVVPLPSPELTVPQETEIKIDTQDNPDKPKVDEPKITETASAKNETQESLNSTEQKSIKSIKIEAKDTLEEETIATIEIPKSESVKVTEKQIIIETPAVELETKTKTGMPNWLRNILSTLRRKLEDLAHLLPQ